MLFCIYINIIIIYNHNICIHIYICQGSGQMIQTWWLRATNISMCDFMPVNRAFDISIQILLCPKGMRVKQTQLTLTVEH